jgi:hypothetical protein
VQPCLDRSRIDAEKLGCLLGVEFLNVAEEKNFSVRLGQLIDACPNLSARFRSGELSESAVFPRQHRVAMAAVLVEGRKQVVELDLAAP